MQKSVFFEEYVPDILDRLWHFCKLGLFDLAQGKRVLVVGCGTGFFSYHLAQAGADITGVDIAPQNVERCRQVVKAGRFLVADANTLPFPDNSFDLVFCSEVLEHTGDYQRGLSEICRVLRPQGHLLLSFPIRPTLPTTRWIYDGCDRFCLWYFGPEHPMTHKEQLDLQQVAQELQSARCEILQARRIRNTLATCLGESMIVTEKLLRMILKGRSGRQEQLVANLDYTRSPLLWLWRWTGLPLAKALLRLDRLLCGHDSSCGILLARKLSNSSPACPGEPGPT